jgi:hypothetical protein
MTRKSPRHGRPATHTDRLDILAMLGDSMIPDIPTLETLLDRVEQTGAGR